MNDLGAFHLGSVTDRNGNECGDAAYITVGSDDGQAEDDCQIELTGHNAARIARLIVAAPALAWVFNSLSEDLRQSFLTDADVPAWVRRALTSAQSSEG